METYTNLEGMSTGFEANQGYDHIHYLALVSNARRQAESGI